MCIKEGGYVRIQYQIAASFITNIIEEKLRRWNADKNVIVFSKSISVSFIWD